MEINSGRAAARAPKAAPQRQIDSLDPHMEMGGARLSITKINAASNQRAAKPGGNSYPHYLGAPTTRQRGDFDYYARGEDDIAEAEQVERLAKGFHPVTSKPLVKGAGDGHVMGFDMTFSAPKDFSAAVAACYTHFSSWVATDPHLHVHAFMFNVGKRQRPGE